MNQSDNNQAVSFTKTSGQARNELIDSQVLAMASLPNRIANLGLGDTCSESKFLDFDKTDKASFDESVKALRSTMSKAAARAKERTGNSYITVTGDHRTRDGDIIVIATAVRVG